MEVQYLYLLLYIFTAVTVALRALLLAFCGRKGLVVPLVISSVVFTAVCLLCPGVAKESAWSLFHHLVAIQAKPKAVLAMLVAIGIGSLNVAVCAAAQGGSRRFMALLGSVFGEAILVSSVAVIIWDLAYDIERSVPVVYDKNLLIEEVAEFELNPIRVAAGSEEGAVYVSAYSTKENGQYKGFIYGVETGSVSETARGAVEIVAASPLLYRPFGLAFADGKLYVSRAGHHASAVRGVVSYGDFGTLTVLEDHDQDGRFEYFHDVCTGLPAARGPDTMHQNNGICVADDGSIFVAVGSADDRSIDENPFSGTILRIKQGSDRPEVFARGLRNPFGLTMIGSERLLVTDNDSADDGGDELDFVLEGAHFGHPYSVPGDEQEGFDVPLLVGEGSNYVGVACRNLSEKEGITTAEVLLCDLSRSLIYKVDLEIKGNTAKVIKRSDFARVSTPVDISVADDGTVYVISYYKKRLYRIRRSA